MKLSCKILENKLSHKIKFLEENRKAIALTDHIKDEVSKLTEVIEKINQKNLILSFQDFIKFFVIAVVPAIGAQFFGGIYTDQDISSLDKATKIVLNILIMQTVRNVYSVSYTLNHDYQHIKLNLKELENFDLMIEKSQNISRLYNKMSLNFVDSSNIIMTDFSVFKPSGEEEIQLMPILKNVTISLDLLKVYKLEGKSGIGKSAILKSFLKKWEYTDGVIEIPKNFDNHVGFIPQIPFLPQGSLIEILFYPKAIDDSFRIDRSSSFIEEKKDLSLNSYLLQEVESDSIMSSSIQTVIYSRVKKLLFDLKLLPNTIKEEEIYLQGIDWNKRLSGGEKQKLIIIRSLLTDPKLLIMDEPTAHLDDMNRELVYKVIKRELLISGNEFCVIYTDHGTTIKSFTDNILLIGENDILVDSIN